MANATWIGGKRFVTENTSLDEYAQEAGYPDFATMEAQDPAAAQDIVNRTPGQGNDTQVADSDDVNWGRIGAIGAGTVAAGFLPALFGGGGAAVAPSAAAGGGLPVGSGVSGLTLPTATLGATPGAAATTGAAVAPGAFAGYTPQGPTLAQLGREGGRGLLNPTLGRGLLAAGEGLSGVAGANAYNRGVTNDANAQRDTLATRIWEAQNNQALGAYNANTNAQSAHQNVLSNRADLEGRQRAGGLRNLYRQSYAENPAVGPFNPKGTPQLSPAFLEGLGHEARYGGEQLARRPSFHADQMPMPEYAPPPAMTAPPELSRPQSPTGGAGGTAINTLAPILSTIGRLFGGR
jgi:hypothetical protein